MKIQFCFLSISFLIGCAGQGPISSTLSKVDKPALHAIKSKRLSVLMRELNDLMFELMMTEVQKDRQRRYQTEQIASAAEQLIKSIEQIPDALPHLSLEKQEKQIFLGLNKKLKQQLTSLKHEAAHNHVDAIPDRAQQVAETCNACHDIFSKHTIQ